MISYQWDSQQLMIRLKNALQQAGYNVWMDVEKMGKILFGYTVKQNDMICFDSQ